MNSFVQQIKRFFENIQVTPAQWILSFSGILLIRFFLEAFSSPSLTGAVASDMPTLVHYFLWFLGLALSIMLFMYIVLPEWKKAIPGLILFGFTATWLAPILDFIVSGGRGFKMTYLFQHGIQLVQSYLTFFGDPRYGITTGIHVEVMLIIIFFAVVYYFTQKNIWRTLATSIVLYSIIFIFAAAPSILYIFDTRTGVPVSSMIDTVTTSATATNNIHGNLRFGSETAFLETGFDFLMARIYIPIILVLAYIIFYIHKKNTLLAIIKNSRPERVFHYWLMAFFGIYLAYHISPPHILNGNDYMVFVSLLIAIYSAWMFSVCTNDLADTTIDAVSNTNRPLPSNTLSESDMREASRIFLYISITSAYIAGYYAFFATITFIALYYVYSMPPTRLKKVPFLSSFIISLACTTMVIAGFFTFSQSKMTSTLPISAIVAIVIISFLWANVRDLKDVAGDTKEGILTLPVLFGNVWGPRIVGIFASISYIIAALYINLISIYIISFIWATATYYFCARKTYTEKPLFILYFSWVTFALILTSL